MNLENKLAKKVLGPSLALGLTAAASNVGATPILSDEVTGDRNSIFNYTLSDNKLLVDIDFDTPSNRVVLYVGENTYLNYDFSDFLCRYVGSDYVDCTSSLGNTNIFSGEITINDPSKIFDLEAGFVSNRSPTFVVSPEGVETSANRYANVIDKPIVQEPPVNDVSAPTTLGIFGLALGGLALSRKWKPQVTSKYNSF
jgi:hypothetical protein